MPACPSCQNDIRKYDSICRYCGVTLAPEVEVPLIVVETEEAKKVHPAVGWILAGFAAVALVAGLLV